MATYKVTINDDETDAIAALDYMDANSGKGVTKDQILSKLVTDKLTDEREHQLITLSQASVDLVAYREKQIARRQNAMDKLTEEEAKGLSK